MSSYWINFATTGDPNGKDLPRWPRFMAQGTKVLEFGDQIKVRPLPAMPSFVFFEKDPQVALTGIKMSEAAQKTGCLICYRFIRPEHYATRSLFLNASRMFFRIMSNFNLS